MCKKCVYVFYSTVYVVYSILLGDTGGFGGETKKDNRPFFKTFATLAIPNITMTPGLDEVQQTVNKVG